MITVIIHFRVQVNFIDEFKEHTIANCRERRKAIGCLRAELFHIAHVPSGFILLETFSSQSTIDAFYEHPIYRNWYQAVRPMLDRMDGQDLECLTVEL